jgi:hypothetical protein
MSTTSKTIDDILMQLQTNLPDISDRVKNILGEIYTTLVKMFIDQHQIDQIECVSKLFEDLIQSLNGDLFVTKSSVHDDQIEVLRNQAKLKLDQLKDKCLKSSIDVELFNGSFAELTDCIQSGYDIMSRIFQNVLVIIVLFLNILF